MAKKLLKRTSQIEIGMGTLEKELSTRNSEDAVNANRNQRRAITVILSFQVGYNNLDLKFD
jgi:hypothetical protein